jgi:adenine phosphoribosyltransferase
LLKKHTDLSSLIRNVPDFPKKGIQFKDITTLVKDSDGLKEASEQIAKQFKGRSITKVVAIESRGYIFGSIIAYILGAGFVLVRKPGKLPAKTIKETYSLEYGTDTIEMHEDGINKGEKVLVIDDLLATGGTALAAAHLVEKCGGKVEGIAFVIELTESLHGRDKLQGYNVVSLVQIPVHE